MKQRKSIFAFPTALILALILLSGTSARAVSVGDRVIPGGSVVGIELRAEGVIVSDLADVPTAEGTVRPAESAGIRPGDRIVALDGKATADGAAFLAAADALTGESVSVRLIRGQETLELTVQPVKSTKDRWQLGLWLRESVTGIGTVTYYDPATGDYGALGHGVSLPEGTLMAIAGGAVSKAGVSSVVPGTRGKPGELQGVPGGGVVGSILRNTPSGIFGVATETLSQGPAVPVAAAGEVTLGPAQILSTVGPDGTRAYNIDISRITRGGDGTRQLTITVTDPTLLAVTGGIVQGMSGSPIIQDGKLVGAVTHVLVNDPTRGYGIFIENMLDAAG